MEHRGWHTAVCRCTVAVVRALASPPNTRTCARPLVKTAEREFLQIQLERAEEGCCRLVVAARPAATRGCHKTPALSLAASC